MRSLDQVAKQADSPLTKQEQIVEAACRLFLDDGFETTSMDAIALAANVSKRTVYSHFQNKEALFAEVIGGMCHRLGDPAPGDEVVKGPPQEVLRYFGQQILRRVLNPEANAILRTVIAETGPFPDLGKTLWLSGPDTMRTALSAYLTELAQNDVIKIDDPDVAATQFMGIVSGPYLLKALLGVEFEHDDAKVEASLDSAVGIFLGGIVVQPR